MQECVVTGRMSSNSYCLHNSINEQCDSYLALADAEVEIFWLLAHKTQFFFVHTSVASKKPASSE